MRMRGKWKRALWALALLPALCLPGKAQEETGGILVTMPQVGTAEGAGGGVLTLYYVGSETEDGYRITEAFGGGLVRQEDALSVHLARLLADMTSGTEGTAWDLEAGSTAEFPYLTRGLYLLVQTEAEAGASVIRPFLMPVPLEGQWYIHASPEPARVLVESPKTGQHPAPILGAVGMVLSSIGLAICVRGHRKSRW